ncbi:MAG: hypothetical protein IT379_23165 [Deltaproteobacteria bacterium]|nr:hypothetical protein [Deltaproteobacteria bacterium]
MTTPRLSGWGATRLVASALACAWVAGSPVRAHADPPPTSGRAEAPEAAAQPTQRVTVRVVEIAGGRAYLEPGHDAGIAAGAVVRFGRTRLTVVVANARFAVVELGESRIAIGDEGEADAVPGAATVVRRPPPPRQLRLFRGMWPAARRPALDQRPRYVPLGEVGGSRRIRIGLGATAGAVVPLDAPRETIATGELRAQVHAEPFSTAPLSFDADAAVQAWLARDLDERAGSESRPIVRVRALSAAYGLDDGFHAAAGRLRYAAANLSTLDGIRVAARLVPGLQLAAFGGLVPDPTDGRPSVDASRFGVEALYRDPTSSWRPQASLVAQGSVFDGEIDERRAALSVSVLPEGARLAGSVEASMFDSDNPWGAREIELTEASLDASWRPSWLRVETHLSIWRPERSRWLASFLPVGWTCFPEHDTEVPCTDDDALRSSATLRLGIERARWAAGLGGSVLVPGWGEDPDQLVGFADVRVLRVLRVLRGSLGMTASTGRLLQTASARGEVGASLLEERLDVAVHYRPALSRYRAANEPFVEHLVGFDVRATPVADLDVSLQADVLLGEDADALLVTANVLWRPVIGDAER